MIKFNLDIRDLFNRQSLLRIFFWLLLSYIAISTTFGWVKPKTVHNDYYRELNEYHRVATFAKRFAHEYFFWTVGKEEVRLRRLAEFWRGDHLEALKIPIDSDDKNCHVRYASIETIEPSKDEQNRSWITMLVDTLQTGVEDVSEQKRVGYRVKFAVEKNDNKYKVVSSPELLGESYG